MSNARELSKYVHEGVKTVDTVADLVEMSGLEDNETVLVLGYHEAGDAGGGTFVWDVSINPSEANGGTLVATSSPIGVWRRILTSHYITPEMFGARGNGVNDDTEAIQSALNAVSQAREIVFSASSYLVSDTLVITNYVHLRGIGESYDRPTIQFTAPDKPLFDRGTFQRLKVSDINFIGDGADKGVGATNTCFRLWREAGSSGDLDAEFHRCRFYRFKYAIRAYGRSITAVRCNFSSCRYGFVISKALNETEQVRAWHWVGNRWHSLGSNSTDATVSYRAVVEGVNSSSNLISITGHSFEDDDWVIYRAPSLPAPSGLKDGWAYWVKVINANTIQLFEADSLREQVESGYSRTPVSLSLTPTGGVLDRTSTCIAFPGVYAVQHGGLIEGSFADDCKRFFYGSNKSLMVHGVTLSNCYEIAVETPPEAITDEGVFKDVLVTKNNFYAPIKFGPAFHIRSNNCILDNITVSNACEQGIIVDGDHCVLSNIRVRAWNNRGMPGNIQGILIRGDYARLANVSARTSPRGGTFIRVEGDNCVLEGASMSAGNFLSTATGKVVKGTTSNPLLLNEIGSFSLASPWTEFTGTSGAGYRIVDSYVCFSGRLAPNMGSSSTPVPDATTVLTLPAEIAPLYTLQFPVVWSGTSRGTGCLEILSTGVVRVYGMTGGFWLSLEGIRYPLKV